VTPHQDRGHDRREPLVHEEVHREPDERELEYHSATDEVDEARPRRFRGALRVEDPQSLPELDVLLRLEIELRLVPDLALHDVVVLGQAGRNGLVREVGEIGGGRPELLGDLVQLRLEGLDPVGQLLGRCDRGGTVVGSRLTDRLGGLVVFGAQGLHLAQELPVPRVKLHYAV
jgi:hypothetical protein